MAERAQVCRAVTILHGDKPAAAKDRETGRNYCKSTKFMLVDGEEICAVCWTPKAKEEKVEQ